MSKQCLSIEQTQHLQELGVDMSKTSMCWIIDGENKHKPFITLSMDASDHVDLSIEYHKATVFELIEHFKDK